MRQNKSIYNAANLSDQLLKDIDYNSTKVEKMEVNIRDKKQTEKERLGEITTLRLYRFHRLVPTVLTVIEDPSESETIRIAALEAMSWFPFHIKEKPFSIPAISS